MKVIKANNISSARNTKRCVNVLFSQILYLESHDGVKADSSLKALKRKNSACFPEILLQRVTLSNGIWIIDRNTIN